MPDFFRLTVIHVRENQEPNRYVSPRKREAVHPLYPDNLIGCIHDGRTPNDGEVHAVQEKLWNEALSYRDDRSNVTQLALVALTGSGKRVRV